MTGFKTQTIDPKNLIKDIRRNTRKLSYSNLDSTIQRTRDLWDSDYGKRTPSTPLTKEDIFISRNEEWNSISNPETQWVNRKFIGTKVLFTSFTDHWCFQIIEFPDGDKEFSFNVLVGEVGLWHVGEVENYLQGIDEESIRDWKRMVMSSWKDSVKFFLDESQKSLPGYKAWSVTCSEKSTKLLKQIKDDRLITLQQGICFLFL